MSHKCRLRSYKNIGDAESDVDTLAQHNIELQQQLALRELESVKLRTATAAVIKAHKLTVKRPAETIEKMEQELEQISTLVEMAKQALSTPTTTEHLDAYVKGLLGEPVAWEWKRTHLAGGYTRQVTISEQQAIEWAADSSNLHQKDAVTPLYAMKDKS